MLQASISRFFPIWGLECFKFEKSYIPFLIILKRGILVILNVIWKKNGRQGDLVENNLIKRIEKT